jgi:hypothetical protein
MVLQPGPGLVEQAVNEALGRGLKRRVVKASIVRSFSLSAFLGFWNNSFIVSNLVLRFSFFARFFPPFTPVVAYADHAHVPYLTFIHRFYQHISDMDD